MRCLFCKQDSSSSKSVEHIVPESLGNEGKVLERGIVCDQCNRYFGTKIEKPFLDLDEIKNLRFIIIIPSKKNKIPPIKCVVNRNIPATIHRDINPETNVVTSKLEFSKAGLEENGLHNGQRVQIEYASVPRETSLESTFVVSRFIAKVALEMFTFKYIAGGNDSDAIVDSESLDMIRKYARYGSQNVWPCLVRRIYNPTRTWPEEDERDSNIIFEGDSYFIEAKDQTGADDIRIAGELYYVIVIWSIEFVINMTKPSLDSYIEWMKEFNNQSILHPYDGVE